MVGERIQERLALLGISQAELARRVGVRQPTIAKLVSGKSRNSAHLHRIARELQTTSDYLTGESDDPAKDAPESVLSSEEEKLVNVFRELDRGGRMAILEVLERMRGHRSVHEPVLAFAAAGGNR